MRKRTFVFLVPLIVLAIPLAGVLGLWAIDGNFWRGVVSRHVGSATGRKLEIIGLLTIDWGFSPTITLAGVKLANAPWAATPTMLELERLGLQVRLLPLLAGSLEIDRLTLTGRTLELGTAADGKQDWDLAGTAASADPAAAEAEPIPNVQLAALTDGIIRYRSNAGGAVTTAQIAHGRLSGAAPGAAADVVLAGELDGVATGL